jgi:predicted nucleic acid-binding protein
MRFVLDASITINWAMPDESHSMADFALQELRRGSSAAVPGIWWYEVRNILVVNERRNRISPADSIQFLKNLDQFTIEIDPQRDGTEILELSRRTGRTVYDAAYLALAMRDRLPLATLDKSLQAAAVSAGIPLLA